MKIRQYTIFHVLLILLLGCGESKKSEDQVTERENEKSEKVDNNTEVKDNHKELNIALENFGFMADYSTLKTINLSYTFLFEMRKLLNVSKFLTTSELSSELKTILNSQNNYYPINYGWLNENQLVLELHKTPHGEIDENLFYSYRQIVIDIESKKFHYLDLYKNNEIGGIRISKQNHSKIIYYDIKRSQEIDEVGDNYYLYSYEYTKNEYDLISGIKKVISKGKVPKEIGEQTNFDTEKYFSELK